MALNAPPNPRIVLSAAVAVLLLATLVFLFVRTQGVEYKALAQALTQLRAMQDMDSRWDADARALVSEAARGDVPPPDRASLIDRALRDIERGPSAKALAGDIAALRAGLAEKVRAYGALREADEAVRKAPREARAAALETRQSALDRFEFQTLGGRLSLLQRTLADALERGLDDSDRWRVYLAFYAAALLIGVGALAARVTQAQAALRHANETLEQRVDERTAELQQALERLRESEAQLVQTEKMSSLGQLVAGVAHEINTPLAYVKNSVASVSDRLVDLEQAIAQSEQMLAMLQSESPNAEALQACFAALGTKLAELSRDQVLHDLETLTRDGLHGIEQISDLVNNLRNFSRLDRSRVASYNVNESVRGTLLIARPHLRNVDVDKHLGEIPSITCSPSQVNQVLLNLVTNAAQAMDKPDGRITITTRSEGPRNVVIEVADNGRGIPPDVMPRIFDPFFTTKDVGKGTGLGLSIAYKIVAAHGGRIDVRSSQGAGATFTVILPVEPPPEAMAAAVRRAGEEAAA
jgi:two-component system NtrC family sensor kinase